jgi:signal transduction histidine kinase
MKTGSFLFIVVVTFASAFAIAVPGQTSPGPLILDGTHKFSPDDSPVYAIPTYDDSQWQLIIIPGTWQSQNIKPSSGIGWYRIHCTIPDDYRNVEPAIFLGRIGDADELFFNGFRIGGEGVIGEQFVEASKIERLYKIPSEYIRFETDNVIAVRVMNTYLNGGIFDREAAVGDYRDLRHLVSERHEKTLIGEFCFFTLFSLFFLACLFFYMKGLRDKEYFYFWFFITLYAALFFLSSVTFYETGLKTRFVQQTINAVSALFPASMILLLLHFYKKQPSAFMKIIIASFIGIALLTVVFHTYTVRMYLHTVWNILFLIAAVYLIFLAGKAFIRTFYESGVILLGISGIIFGFVLESLGGIDLLHVTGFFLWDYAAVFFMICVMYALTSRYTRIKELQSASIKIFEAHEKERRRLARELHDGIGTSLLATKLKLQMLEAQAKEEKPINKQAFPELIAEIDSSIEELRAVSMDIRPAFLENTDLIEAITWHARKVKERSGVEIDISAGSIGDISLRIKENFYRIFQEALNNAVKHSGAAKVEALLSRDGSYLVLEIHDNGKGFSHSVNKGEQGIGLYTIRERVELLDGIIRITSSDKIGTNIYIEVPVQ